MTSHHGTQPTNWGPVNNADPSVGDGRQPSTSSSVRGRSPSSLSTTTTEDSVVSPRRSGSRAAKKFNGTIKSKGISPNKSIAVKRSARHSSGRPLKVNLKCPRALQSIRKDFLVQDGFKKKKGLRLIVVGCSSRAEVPPKQFPPTKVSDQIESSKNKDELHGCKKSLSLDLDERITKEQSGHRPCNSSDHEMEPHSSVERFSSLPLTLRGWTMPYKSTPLSQSDQFIRHQASMCNRIHHHRESELPRPILTKSVLVQHNQTGPEESHSADCSFVHRSSKPSLSSRFSREGTKSSPTRATFRQGWGVGSNYQSDFHHESGDLPTPKRVQLHCSSSPSNKSPVNDTPLHSPSWDITKIDEPKESSLDRESAILGDQRTRSTAPYSSSILIFPDSPSGCDKENNEAKDSSMKRRRNNSGCCTPRSVPSPNFVPIRHQAASRPSLPSMSFNSSTSYPQHSTPSCLEAQASPVLMESSTAYNKDDQRRPSISFPISDFDPASTFFDSELSSITNNRSEPPHEILTIDKRPNSFSGSIPMDIKTLRSSSSLPRSPCHAFHSRNSFPSRSGCDIDTFPRCSTRPAPFHQQENEDNNMSHVPCDSAVGTLCGSSRTDAHPSSDVIIGTVDDEQTEQTSRSNSDHTAIKSTHDPNDLSSHYSTAEAATSLPHDDQEMSSAVDLTYEPLSLQGELSPPQLQDPNAQTVALEPPHPENRPQEDWDDSNTRPAEVSHHLVDLLDSFFGIALDNPGEASASGTGSNMVTQITRHRRRREHRRDSVISARDYGESQQRHSEGRDKTSKRTTLPTVLFDARKMSLIAPENVRCSICLEDFRHLDKRSFLPCFHSFHKHCISRWLQRSSLCPICLLDIRKLLKLARLRRCPASSKTDSLCDITANLAGETAGALYGSEVAIGPISGPSSASSSHESPNSSNDAIVRDDAPNQTPPGSAGLYANGPHQARAASTSVLGVLSLSRPSVSPAGARPCDSVPTQRQGSDHRLSLTHLWVPAAAASRRRRRTNISSRMDFPHVASSALRSDRNAPPLVSGRRSRRGIQPSEAGTGSGRPLTVHRLSVPSSSHPSNNHLAVSSGSWGPNDSTGVNGSSQSLLGSDTSTTWSRSTVELETANTTDHPFITQATSHTANTLIQYGSPPPRLRPSSPHLRRTREREAAAPNRNPSPTLRRQVVATSQEGNDGRLVDTHRKLTSRTPTNSNATALVRPLAVSQQNHHGQEHTTTARTAAPSSSLLNRARLTNTDTSSPPNRQSQHLSSSSPGSSTIRQSANSQREPPSHTTVNGTGPQSYDNVRHLHDTLSGTISVSFNKASTGTQALSSKSTPIEPVPTPPSIPVNRPLPTYQQPRRHRGSAALQRLSLPPIPLSSTTGSAASASHNGTSSRCSPQHHLRQHADVPFRSTAQTVNATPPARGSNSTIGANPPMRTATLSHFRRPPPSPTSELHSEPHLSRHSHK